MSRPVLSRPVLSRPVLSRPVLSRPVLSRLWRRPAGWALAAGAAALLAGCSQTAALAPVGGDRLTEVRFAANDVLLQNGVQILTAPVCTASGDAVSCAGSTMDSQPIAVSSAASDQGDLTVTVGGRVLYQGSLQGVLDAAARPSP
jgi:hypothetical protein